MYIFLTNYDKEYLAINIEEKNYNINKPLIKLK